jgi:hypothetical protein
MKQPLLIVVGISLCVCSCTPRSYESDQTQAYVPIYAQPVEVNTISVIAAQTTEKAGKIYAFGNYIFQNDLNKGIHIINNTDQGHPQKVAFLKIPYNTEFAVKGNFIYANNMNDLVVIDIHDLMHAAVVKRIKDAFPYISQSYPPQGGYFVCPDPSKGIVVDWQLQTVKMPACRR